MSTYKKYFDGLRAVAIISVIIYHANINFFNYKLFSGGYLGVDIFFVISGYLITFVIVNDFEKNKKFSILNFADKRIRRIFPVLILIIIFFYLPFFFNLVPSSFIAYLKSTNSIFLFNTNFHFNDVNQVYGDDSSLEKPFLHIWSIAIEFQFYAFTSILFFLLFKIKSNINFYILILILIFLFSIIYCQINYKINPTSNFYLPFGRLWEFIFGALLFLIEKKKFINFDTKITRHLPLLGFIIISICLLTFKKNSPHPSLLTIIPVFSLGLIILFNKPKEIINRLLNFSILLKIGIISYSLYILHYPIFALVRVVVAKTDHIFFLSLVKLSLPIILISFSLLSYYFVERKFRDKNFINNKTFYTLLIFLSFLILSINHFSIKKKPSEYIWNVDEYNFDKSPLGYEINKLFTKHMQKTISSINSQHKKKNILIVGNSFGNDLFIGFKENLKFSQKFNFYHVPMQIKCLSYYLATKPDKNCTKNFNKFNKFTSDEFLGFLAKIDKLVIYSKYSAEDINFLNNNIEILKNFFKKQIIIINNQPHYTGQNRFGTIWWYDLDDFIYKTKKFPNKMQILQLEKKYYINNSTNHFSVKELNKKIYKFAIENNIDQINIHEFFCDDNEKRCKFLDKDKMIINRDYAHFTREGLKFLMDQIYKNYNYIFN